jgi:RND family efflux transporter MFP subunit
MKTIKGILLVMISAIVLSSCGSDKNSDNNTSDGIKVTTSVLDFTTVIKKHHYTGTVASVKQSALSTRIMGQINKVYVSEGDRVRKGELLLSIRSNDILAKKKQVEANIIQAEAAFKHASDDFKRIQSLFESKSATQKELDDITVHLEMTKAQLEVAKKAKEEVVEMLSYADIRAPYAGVVTQRFVDAGDMANPGMPLIGVEAPGLFEVQARVPESDIYLLAVGDSVEVRLDNTDEVIKGSLSHVSPSSRFSGSQFTVRIALLPTSEQEEKIHSGVFARVDLLKGKEQKLLVPTSALVERGQLTGVWVKSA